MNLFPINDPSHAPTNQRPLAKDAYEVAGHGGPDFMEDSNGNPISAKKLAELIKADPAYDANKPIRLRSCGTGDERSASGRNFAQDLANELNNLVQAPTRNLKSDYQAIRVNPFTGEVTYKNGPDIIRAGGIWKCYSPQR